MTPAEVLDELLRRVTAAGGKAIITGNELTRWPDEAVHALKKQNLMVKTKPALSANCSGCEEGCSMPVHIMPTVSGHNTACIICDKRDDVHRVAVSIDTLEQWQISYNHIARFVASALALRYNGSNIADGTLLELGIVKGSKKVQMLALSLTGDLALVAGDKRLSLLDVVGFSENAYGVDTDLIKHLVDTSSTGDPRYTPGKVKQEARKLNTQAMYETWHKAYRVLKKDKPGKTDSWYSQQIAKRDIAQGRDAETIRKRMKQ